MEHIDTATLPAAEAKPARKRHRVRQSDAFLKAEKPPSEVVRITVYKGAAHFYFSANTPLPATAPLIVISTR